MNHSMVTVTFNRALFIWSYIHTDSLSNFRLLMVDRLVVYCFMARMESVEPVSNGRLFAVKEQDLVDKMFY